MAAATHPHPTPLTRRSFLRVAGHGVLGLSLTGALAGCGGGSSSGRELRAAWFGGEERHQATIEAFKIIERRVEGLAVGTEYGGFEGYFDKFTTQVSGGNAPELIQTNFGQVDQFAARNALLDLSEYVGKGLDLSGVPETEVEGGRFEGKTYGISLGSVVCAAIVDNTALATVGMSPPQAWDWASYAEFATEVARASGGALAGAEDSSSYGRIFEIWLLHRGKPGMFDEAGVFVVTAEEAGEWFEYWAALRRSGACVPIDVQAAHTDGDHPSNPLVIGKAALALQFNTTRDVWASITPNELAFHAMPTGGPGGKPGSYTRPAAMWSVSQGTENVDLAVQVIDLFLNDPEVARVLAFNRGVPGAHALEAIGTDVSESQQKLLDYTTSVIEGELVTAPRTPPTVTEMAVLQKRFADEIAFERMSVAQAAAAFVEEAAAAARG